MDAVQVLPFPLTASTVPAASKFVLPVLTFTDLTPEPESVTVNSAE